jgi:EAL domain-containing protein (putative c-di-GMP-specific phosphodiesterase class I)
LAQRVLQRLDELALPHSTLTIEVTESVFLGDGATLAREALQTLDQQGVRTELDDFGTGYASLTHLRAYPVSRLKIDRSFIESLGPDSDSRVIVQAVVDLAHNLNCEVVAEGVETASQAVSSRLSVRPSSKRRTNERIPHVGGDQAAGALAHDGPPVRN